MPNINRETMRMQAPFIVCAVCCGSVINIVLLSWVHSAIKDPSGVRSEYHCLFKPGMKIPLKEEDYMTALQNDFELQDMTVELTNCLWMMRIALIALLVLGPVGIVASYMLDKWLVKGWQNTNSLFSFVSSACCLWAWIIANSEGAVVCGGDYMRGFQTVETNQFYARNARGTLWTMSLIWLIFMSLFLCCCGCALCGTGIGIITL